jgi:hypothetical protein
MPDIFEVVPNGELQQYQPLVAASIQHYQSNGIGVSIKAGTIVCLYIGADGSLLADWIDDAWSFKFSVEQIISDLNEELPHMLYGVSMQQTGDIVVLCGELADDAGHLTQAYRCACNARDVCATLT